MTSLADRFRHWYEYERDCNAKALAMLASVPTEKVGDPAFARAVGKMAHLVAARLRWLHRLGQWPVLPDGCPKNVALESRPGQVAEVEAAWVKYLAPLSDVDLAREVEFTFSDGQRLRYSIEGVLTQVHGHALYHRGQIAMLVADLGGQHTDTDYLFWHKPTPV